MNQTDIALLAMLAEPHKKDAAFSSIVRLYQERIYWHIRKMLLDHEDTNDVMQNTFLKAWNGIDSFRGDSLISTWLYRIATNETLTFLATKRLKHIGSMEDEESLMFQNLKADSYFDGNDAERKLQEAILTLPEKQRLVFNMKYFEDITYEKLEEILGTSAGALKASYHHAVKKIERYLETEAE
ncbi:MAG: RNA polymerase subunit sigma-70 [Porphyromonadaceae bacterium CG2_30_38_12]|nr:MAG: RNA polymerase subunit sigma-70 [Porphyromonadaceae bacterium CG2_30_38_12]